MCGVLRVYIAYEMLNLLLCIAFLLCIAQLFMCGVLRVYIAYELFNFYCIALLICIAQEAPVSNAY